MVQSKQKPLILLSNDDGITAPGIKILARVVKSIAEVVIVAPEREQSASSHSLTLHRPLRIRRLGTARYAVDGTPTDCITLAVNQILKQKPDLVLSGINRGANLGDDVHYSGTVSAAMEGAIHGLPAVAISLALFRDEKTHYQTAADFCVRLCQRLWKTKIPAGTLLNVNVPNRSESELQGWEMTRLGKRNYGGVIVEKIDPRGGRYYWIGGDQTGFQKIKGSDCMAVSEGKISVTPLYTDLTHHSFLKELRRWKRL